MPVRSVGSGADGIEDSAEGAGTEEAGGIDDGPDRGLSAGSPHRPVAIGDLLLHDGRPQSALATVVGRLDATGMVEEDQELIASAADPGLQVTGQVTAARRGEDGPKLPIQAPALGGQCRGGQ